MDLKCSQCGKYGNHNGICKECFEKILVKNGDNKPKIMRERENWDVLCEVCDKTIERGVSTESGDNYCDSCYEKLVYGNKDK
ncbi:MULTISPECIES: hypothetical protein [Bacillus]|uniref:Phage protein n=1 Tax=Bacillus cereus (strain ATCC 14579 / DSM 31 / CCUG 7414 / JCM 2152 / NBRC 15305 / NCIMB 9373 / NCTC 2599 / NRRL B-3711) TaxID=226900 RepID=Q81EU1_BACCR|nr:MULTISPECIES: hypothetical protein [Bacillus cereus group]NP_852507.1 hypothetical protein BC1873 [Bacillus phage phBC6A51]AAP08847.1 Phage protein [Bacillus cereus ATCC 14579]EEL11982.1 hypothetical protein bcere0015_17600 [Bacillus cereus BDRD-Cer4]KIP24522.1 hypothetical protein BG10_5246 [Bacillus thuringiensis serovar morrisoni]MCC3287392.1 hypothetical protein [Bacillus cereus]MCT6947476.1 hypothetical protein [Bacillus thuringiensis]